MIYKLIEDRRSFACIQFISLFIMVFIDKVLARYDPDEDGDYVYMKFDL